MFETIDQQWLDERAATPEGRASLLAMICRLMDERDKARDLAAAASTGAAELKNFVGFFSSTFPINAMVEKVSGSPWHGRVCGFYSTSSTPFGVCVESTREPGSVQIYPAKALCLTERKDDDPT